MDGGATWIVQSSGTTQSFAGVSFSADMMTGYAVAGNGTVVKTVDGGTTWSGQNSDTDKPLESVWFSADLGTVYAVGGNGTIVRTTNIDEILP
jgi:photosystem II stability/assembly factor-like uncharacterized protein